MTPSDQSTVSLEHLVAQSGWLRRIAARLVGNDADAADVAQEAMISAWRRPPARPGDRRSWLAVVTLNRARDWRRRQTRRDFHDAASAAQVPAVPTPADLVAGVEIHRLVAEQVSALAEPFRRTVVLHFYDGLSAADIARQLGVPAGTVRWRLKEAIDRLRRGLDERCDGERRTWVRGLVPLLRAGAPAPGLARAPTSERLGAWSSLAPSLPVLGLAALGLALVQRCDPGGGPSATPRSSATAPPALNGPPPALERAAVGVARSRPGDLAGGAAACERDLRVVYQELTAEEARWRGAVSAARVFAKGTPNPTAMSVLEPIVAAAVAREPTAGQTHVLECRTWACRLIVVEPSTELGKKPASPAVESVIAALQEPPRIQGYLTHIGRPAREPVTGSPLAQLVLYATLRHPSGEPAGPPAQPTPAPPIPKDQAACAAELSRSREALATMRAEIAAAEGPRHRFDEKARNPALAAEVERQIDRVLTGLGKRGEVAVECRGRSCRLSSPALEPGELWGHLGEDVWFRTRYDDVLTTSKAFYLSLAEHQRADGAAIVTALMGRVLRAPAVADCARRSGAKGRLRVRLFLHGTPAAQRAAKAGSIEVTMDGDLAERPVADCLQSLAEAAISDTAVPADVTAGLAERWLAFDGRGGWREAPAD